MNKLYRYTDVIAKPVQQIGIPEEILRSALRLLVSNYPKRLKLPLKTSSQLVAVPALPAPLYRLKQGCPANRIE